MEITFHISRHYCFAVLSNNNSSDVRKPHEYCFDIPFLYLGLFRSRWALVISEVPFCAVMNWIPTMFNIKLSNIIVTWSEKLQLASVANCCWNISVQLRDWYVPYILYIGKLYFWGSLPSFFSLLLYVHLIKICSSTSFNILILSWRSSLSRERERERERERILTS
jgi:hypothetical protein